MPFVSNRTGEQITAEQATEPDYWVGQLRNTVNFADCITTLSAPRKRVYLEVGPGKALSSLAQMMQTWRPRRSCHRCAIPIRTSRMTCISSRCWRGFGPAALDADWSQIWGEARRNRVVLPTYQFQRAKLFHRTGAGRQRRPRPRAKADR